MPKLYPFLIALVILATPAIHSEELTALQDRIARESRWKADGLWILPHRPNYFMPMSYNPHPNDAPFSATAEPLGDVETKFQFSMKVPVVEHLFQYDIATVFAYTQVSYWQTYNQHDSSLFRETDYEPEVFLQFNTLHRLGPVTNRYSRLGYDHQSNGQQDPNSRSWNRMYAEFIFDKGPGMFSIKPWFRIPGPAEKDSNPAMAKYYGYGELRGALKVFQRQELSLLFRNNLRIPENKGAIELGWAFPLIGGIKGFVQYFNGYGESLLDYNVPASRISVGFAVSDWL
jgi:phospholipase A1